MNEANTEEGEVLTGAELFHYLCKRNEEQLLESRIKINEYTQLRDVLQNLTDRCRVPVLAPVAGGMAYFESTMDYTNNILVLLGDSWFAERSAKQACEIASRRLDFLRQEEVTLVAEAKALMERQSLFLAEVPNAEQAMAEVEAVKANAIHSRKGSHGTNVEVSPKPAASTPTRPDAQLTSVPLGTGEMTPWMGPEDRELAVIDELDQLTEEELLQIEEELGDQIEDDELVERIMTERLIAKKEKRVQEQLRRRQSEEMRLSTATSIPQTVQEEQQQCSTAGEGIFGTPGDIGRVAASVVSSVMKRSSDEVSSSTRRVKFSDVVHFVPPDEPPAAVKRPVTIAGTSSSTDNVLGEVVEHDVRSSWCPNSTYASSAAATDCSVNGSAAATVTATATKKKKSLFRSELDKGTE